jgi:O-antigen/teichoic acid export membrane protein
VKEVWGILGQSVREFATHRLARQMGLAMVLMAATKMITVFAGAWAVRCLGPDSLSISTMIFTTVAQLGLLSGTSLDALVIRRYKNLPTAEARHQFAVEVTNHRLFLGGCMALIGFGLFLVLGLSREWLLAALAGAPLLIFYSIQPTWVIAAEEKSHLRYVISSFQSLVVAALFVACFHRGQRAGSDVVVMATGAAVAFFFATTVALKWRNPLPIDFRALRTLWPMLKDGRWLVLTAVVLYAQGQIDLALLGYLRHQDIGIYGVAYKIVGPVQEICLLLQLVLYPRFVEWQKLGAQEMWKRQTRLSLVFAAGLIPAGLVALVTVPVVMHALYGAAFQAAAYPTVILLIGRGVWVISLWFSLGLWAGTQDRRAFLILLPVALVTLVLTLLLVPRYGMWAAASVNLLSQVLVCVGFFWAAYHKAHSTPSLKL